VLLYTGISVIKGIPEPSSQAVVGELTPGWPADEAGLLPGDRIVAVAGEPIENWDDLLAAVHPRAEVETEIVVARVEQEERFTLTPKAIETTIDGESTTIGQIGIGPEVVFRPGSAGEILLSGVYATTNIVTLVAGNIWKLVTLQVSIRDLGGPIMIAKLSGDSARKGIVHLLSFIGFISVNIGCFNLLPIPALDGGHLLILSGEALIRREMPVRARMAVQQAGMLLLLALVVLIVVNDAQRIFGFEWLRSIFH